MRDLADGLRACHRVQSGGIEPLRIDRADLRKRERVEQQLLQSYRRPGLSQNRRHREQHRLRRARIGRVVLERDRRRLRRGRHDFDPFVDHQPDERLGERERRVRLHDER